MLVLEPLPGIRVVATPGGLDGASWDGRDVTVLRITPDEALGLGADRVQLDDPDAVIEPETGFVGVRLSAADLDRLRAHIDWPIPTDAGTLAQGKVAGVPAKLLVGDPPLLVVQAAYAVELVGRLR